MPKRIAILGSLLMTLTVSAVDQNIDTELDPSIATGIGDLFERVVKLRQGEPPKQPAKRAVFLKPHGCAQGTFEIGVLPKRYRQGLFAQPGMKKAWLRISSDTGPSTPDSENSTIGFSIKVLGVPGKKILPGQENATTQDFLLQNHPVFFVDTAQDFLDFTETIFKPNATEAYLEAHPKFRDILESMKKPVANVLKSTYWSTTPYQFGANNHVKYKVIPCSPGPEESPGENPNYLAERMKSDFQNEDACFELQVQLRKIGMPLDQATVEWSEAVSPPRTVARLLIPAQNIEDNAKTCEDMSFAGMHSLPEHKPVGSVNQARALIYQRLSTFRKAVAEPSN